ncbi:MAG: peptide chain release factor N(5)-glutamine methyltransferase, partial [Steroidobacteraceae bacterium]
MKRADNLAEPAMQASGPGPSVRRALAEASAALGAAHESAWLEAELLLAHVLRRARSHLHAHPEQTLDAHSAAHYRSLLRRRIEGEPLAYLTGEREFWSLPLIVSPAVLIPRPETELVVERALALLSEPRSSDAGARRVAELGTGSGAIVLALAAERPHWRLVASDRCAAALHVARLNARRLSLAERIEFLEGDWFAPLGERRFHAILSNPPYLSDSQAGASSLRYEPPVALSAGPSGLEALTHLIAHAGAFLEPGGWLV